MTHELPVETISELGLLKAKIWKNFSNDGDFYTAEFVRGVKVDDVPLRESRTFNHDDLLILANLVRKAHDRIGELRYSDALEAASSR